MLCRAVEITDVQETLRNIKKKWTILTILFPRGARKESTNTVGDEC